MANIENLKKRFNTPVSGMQVSVIRQIDEQVSSIEGIIKLTLGAPNFNTPEHIKAAGIRAIEENWSHYTPNAGLLETREAACSFMKKKYDVDFDPKSEALITVGATEAIAAAIMATCNPGDVILVADPAFVLYEITAEILGVEIAKQDVRDTNFLLTPEHIAAAVEKYGERLKLVVVNYPSNPCGTTYTKNELLELAEEFSKHDVFVLSDEIYAELSYEEDHTSLGKYIKDQIILVNGLSKSHAMTGWRIGLILAPQYIMQRLMVTHQALATAATTIAQKAATEAWLNGLDDAQVMKKEYQKRRDLVAEKMGAMGFEIAKPDGAFYIFAKIPAELNQNSVEFVLELAEGSKVALIPGSAFGENGEGYVRLSYAASYEDLAEAMRRMAEYLK
ncbi:MAG: aminotransferase class I/II-fold pyridoxal phosphate-dependent enzyme [Lactobacillales bacterium]|jgi:aminotransferase|nr:aminotransferase class I/II-fold pyridoxal phosphate-dependent enzyme [Lactobacillales bacterium]